MDTESLLASLEEFLDIKRESQGSGDTEALILAKKRLDLSLKEFFRHNFDRAFLEERRRTSSETRKIEVISTADAKVAWADVVKMLDFINSCPYPLKDCRNVVRVEKWMKVYLEWYAKRMSVLNGLTMPSNMTLDLDLDGLEDKK